MGVGKSIDASLIFRITVGEEFDKEPNLRTMRHKIGRPTPQQGLTTAEVDVDRTQPLTQLRNHLLPIFQIGRIFLPTVLPDIAVHALGVTPIGDHDSDRGGAAMVGIAPTREGAKTVVYPLVNFSVHLI